MVNRVVRPWMFIIKKLNIKYHSLIHNNTCKANDFQDAEDASFL